MNRLRTLARCLGLALALCSSAFATEKLRVATYNVEGIDFSTAGYTSLVDVLKRMNADVVMIEEVDGSSEASQIGTLATAAGYSHWRVANASSSLTGGLRNAVLSKHPIASHVSWTSPAISGDPSANDITREILQVTVSVPQVCQPVAFFVVHLKASSTSTDDFRRAVEILRLKKVIENYKNANPAHHIVLGGDFNDDVNDGPFGNTFNTQPGGLPASYDLGSDLSFPIVYDPFNTIAAIGGLSMQYLDSTLEDCSTCYLTRAASGRRLDYVWTPFSTIRLGDETYASSVDNGVDDGAIGNFMRKSLTPQPSGASASAADHYPVFGDLLYESCHGSRFGTASSGSHLLGPRAGIRGTPVLGDGTFAFRLRNARPSSPAVLVFGQNKLSPPFGFPLAPYVPGANLYVDVNTAYGLFTFATDAAGNADFPLPLPAVPGYAGLKFDTQWFVADAGSPNGVGAMSDAYEVVLQ